MSLKKNILSYFHFSFFIVAIIFATKAHGQKTPPVINIPSCNCHLNASVTANVSCYGGSDGSATANAGEVGTDCASPGADNNNADYSWNTTPVQHSMTAVGLSAGNYIVSWDNGSGDCALLTKTVTITEPSAITVSSVNHTNSTCTASNGSATVNASGGTGTLTYLWNPSGQTTPTANSLPAGTYTCTIKDANACSTHTVVSFGASSNPPTVSISSSTNVSCSGGNNGSATVTASGGGGAPYTYSWSPSGGNAATANSLTQGNYTVTVTGSNSCTKTTTVAITQPTVISGTTNSTPASCGGATGGAAVNNVSGGTGTYTYSWSPAVAGNTSATTGLSSGNYSITVTDANNCSKTFVVTVSSNGGIVSANISSQTNVSCHGGSNGSATINVTAGQSPFTYAWSPSGGNAATANNLSSQTYNCTVTDAFGCTKIVPVTISQPATVVTSTAMKNNDVSCYGGNNGSATANPSGGTSPYTYLWSPSGGNAITANNLHAGSNTVTVTDANGCSTTAVVSISQPTQLTSAPTSTAANCAGPTGTATANANGGTLPYTYLWNPSGGTNATATNLSPGAYTVSVHDAHSCNAIGSVTVTSSGGVSANISSTNSVSCNGGNNGVATVTVTSGTSPFTYSWNTVPAENTQTATGLSAGNYSVTVTDHAGCTKIVTATIAQPLVITATVSTNPTPCSISNGSAAVTASGGTGAYTYSWSPSGGMNATASGLPAGSYTVTIKDANSCTKYFAATVTNTGSQTLSISSQSNISCHGGNNGVVTVNAAGGSSPYTYSWSPFGGTNATATGLTAGNYIVTVNDAAGCITTQSVAVTEPSQLNANSNIPSAVCKGSSTTIGVNVSGGTGSYTYSWAGASGLNCTTCAVPSANPTTTTIYTVTITDANLCTVTATATVIVNSLPNISAGNDVTICNGSSAQLISTGGTNYIWSPSSGLSCTTCSNPVASPISPGNYTYTVTGTDINGCTNSDIVVVGVTSAIAPTASISSSVASSVCSGTSVTLSANTNGNAYSWSTGASTSSITVNPTTSATYSVVVSNAGNCTASASSTVNINPPPNVSISGNNLICQGSSTILTITTNAVSYAWNTGATTSSIIVSPTSTANYSVTITDTSGCTGTNSVIVTVNNPPSVSIGGTTTVCSGQNATLSANALGASPFTYTWNTSQTTSSIILTSPTNGSTYTVNVTDSNGCIQAGTVTVSVTSSLLVTTSSTYSTICAGFGNTTLTAAGGTNYAWSSIPPTIPPLPNNDTIVVSPDANTSYTVSVSNASGCTGTSSILINVTSAPPTPTVIPTSVAICFGDSIPSLSATPSAPNSVVWTDPANTFMVYGNSYQPPQNLPAGSYTVVCVQGTGISCLSFPAIIPLVINSLPTANAGSDIVICSGHTAHLNATGGTTYLWSPPEGLNDTAISNPSANPTATTSYHVIVTDGNNCRNKDSVTVFVELNDSCGINIYNMISPNGDGKNDFWWIDGITSFPDNKVQIFNRWGNVVWQGKNYDNDKIIWKGDNQSGDKLPAGTYYYIIELGNKNISGFVELVR